MALVEYAQSGGVAVATFKRANKRNAIGDVLTARLSRGASPVAESCPA